MQSSISKQYQHADLLSATPQRLQFLLVDGAVRFAKQAGEHWRLHEYERGGEAMDRCSAILAEILANIKKERWDVAQTIAALYLFLRKLATEAHLSHDHEKLNRLISVLEIERETWRVLCEQPAGGPTQKTEVRFDTPAPRIMPSFDLKTPAAGFSLEA